MRFSCSKRSTRLSTAQKTPVLPAPSLKQDTLSGTDSKQEIFFLFLTEQTFVKSNSEKDGKFLAIKINKFKIVQNFACISTCNAHFSACNANFSICDARFSTCNAQAVVVCCRFASGFRERSRSSRAQQRHRAAARSPGAPRRCNASGSRSGAPGVNNSLNRFSRNNNRRTTGALISKGGTL